ncbi:MAG: hypothetical protein R3A46_12565 [Thermomicrobiales bacterium]
MIALKDLTGIQHLLGDDAKLLATARNRAGETLVLVDTGHRREGAGRYVTWIVGYASGCLLGHYLNDKQDAIRDLYRRGTGVDTTFTSEEE